MSGTRGGLYLEDLPELAFSGPFTISTWVYLRKYVTAGPGAQILLRGDDRNGNDPYYLTIHANGTVSFAIDSADGVTTEVSAEVPLKTWTRLTAAYDPEAHEMRLWAGGSPDGGGGRSTGSPSASSTRNPRRGIGIGNVQNEKGPHDQPLDGILVDLRVYAAALTPAQAGYPPAQRRIGAKGGRESSRGRGA